MADRRAGMAALMAVALLAAPGCGGGGGGNGGAVSCGKVDPCNGDVVGSWTIAGICTDPSELSAQIVRFCPGFQFTVLDESISGAMTLTADLNYSSTAVLRQKFRLVQPLDCPYTTAATCSDLDAFLHVEGEVTGTCTGTSVCTCDVEAVQPLLGAGGTYLISDTGLFFGEDNGTFGGGGYCVQDGALHFVSTTIILYMAGLGETQIVSDVVAH